MSNLLKALILSPHPDDMEYNMGGTVTKIREKGWIINQMIFSDCSELHGSRFIDGARVSCNHLNVRTFFRRFPNQEFMNHRSDIREAIFNLRANQYNVVFVPCRQDWHQDHQVVTQEAIRIFRKDVSIFGYIKEEIYDRHYDLRVDLTEEQVQNRMDTLALFGIKDIEPINPEWFEVIQLRNYL